MIIIQTKRIKLKFLHFFCQFQLLDPKIAKYFLFEKFNLILHITGDEIYIISVNALLTVAVHYISSKRRQLPLSLSDIVLSFRRRRWLRSLSTANWRRIASSIPIVFFLKTTFRDIAVKTQDVFIIIGEK